MINRLNRFGVVAVPSMMVQYDVLAPYWDVTGDQFVSPLDALVVINALNRQGSAGEGEGEGADGLPARQDTFAATTEGPSLLRESGTLSSSVASPADSAPPVVTLSNPIWMERTGTEWWVGSAAESDDDDVRMASDEWDELLATLGDDVAGQWFGR